MIKAKLVDETLYCERCGISFLWSREEQLAAEADVDSSLSKPEYCAGCRELLTTENRERGLVKWFNHKKRYGFIIRNEAPDLFVHKSALAPNTRLRPGDFVEFTCVDGERGESAQEVVLLMRELEIRESTDTS